MTCLVIRGQSSNSNDSEHCVSCVIKKETHNNKKWHSECESARAPARVRVLGLAGRTPQQKSFMFVFCRDLITYPVSFRVVDARFFALVYSLGRSVGVVAMQQISSTRPQRASNKKQERLCSYMRRINKRRFIYGLSRNFIILYRIIMMQIVQTTRKAHNYG